MSVVVVPCGFHLSALVVGAIFVVVHCVRAPAMKPMVRIDGQWRYGSGDISQLLRAERMIASGNPRAKDIRFEITTGNANTADLGATTQDTANSDTLPAKIEDPSGPSCRWKPRPRPMRQAKLTAKIEGESAIAEGPRIREKRLKKDLAEGEAELKKFDRMWKRMRQKESADMKVTKLKKKDGKADAQNLFADATQACDDTAIPPASEVPSGTGPVHGAWERTF